MFHTDNDLRTGTRWPGMSIAALIAVATLLCLSGCRALCPERSAYQESAFGQVKLLVILTIMWGVQEYGAVWAMTQGGPIDASQVPGMWMYWNAFGIGRMGYASAIGVVMFVITLVFTIINMRYVQTQEY